MTAIFPAQRSGSPATSAANLRFGGIYPLFDNTTFTQYQTALEAQPDQHKLRPYATRIFRELPTILATTRLIANRPADIHILGSSDGSEAYAYAIAAEKQLGKTGAQQVRVIGVDREPFLVDIAKTGYLVCADKEKEWANDTIRCEQHPLQGNGWDTYLKQDNKGPNGLDELTRRYPLLEQLTRDPVLGMTIGHGLNWYQVQQDRLGPVEFRQADMRDYVKNPAVSDKKQQVYVLANAWAYLAQQEGLPAFLNVIQDIKASNQGKDTLIVIGNMEQQLIRQVPQLLGYLRLVGMEPVEEDELQRAGVNKPQKVFGNIWRLHPTGPKVKFTML